MVGRRCAQRQGAQHFLRGPAHYKRRLHGGRRGASSRTRNKIVSTTRCCCCCPLETTPPLQNLDCRSPDRLLELRCRCNPLPGNYCVFLAVCLPVRCLAWLHSWISVLPRCRFLHPFCVFFSFGTGYTGWPSKAALVNLSFHVVFGD